MDGLIDQKTANKMIEATQTGNWSSNRGNGSKRGCAVTGQAQPHSRPLWHLHDFWIFSILKMEVRVDRKGQIVCSTFVCVTEHDRHGIAVEDSPTLIESRCSVAIFYVSYTEPNKAR